MIYINRGFQKVYKLLILIVYWCNSVILRRNQSRDSVHTSTCPQLPCTSLFHHIHPQHQDAAAAAALHHVNQDLTTPGRNNMTRGGWMGRKVRAGQRRGWGWAVVPIPMKGSFFFVKTIYFHTHTLPPRQTPLSIWVHYQCPPPTPSTLQPDLFHQILHPSLWADMKRAPYGGAFRVCLPPSAP